MSLTLEFGQEPGTLVDGGFSASVSTITNGAAPGAACGSIATALAGASGILYASGGQQVAFGGGFNLVTGARPADIRYEPNVVIRPGAQGNLSAARINLPGGNTNLQVVGASSAGVPATGASSSAVLLNYASGALYADAMNVSVKAPTTFTIPIVENGSATLTVSRTGGTLSIPEFNDALPPDSTGNNNYLCTLSADGTGPWTFANVSVGANPMEVDPNTGVVAMVGFCTTSASNFGGVAGVNYFLGASQSATFRVQDSTGAFGYLTVTVTINAIAGGSTDLATVVAAIAPNSVVINPADAVTSGGNITSNPATYNGSGSYPLVPPAGAVATTVGTVACPDSVTKNTFSFGANATNIPNLAAGAAYAGSSSALVAFFDETNIQNTAGTLIQVINPTLAPSSNLMFSRILDAGNHGLQAEAIDCYSTNANGSSIFNSYGATPLNAWSVFSLVADGTQVFNEDGNFKQSFTDGNSKGNTLPATDSFTPTSIQIGVGNGITTLNFQCALYVMAPFAWSWWQREQLYAFIARHWPVTAFTPPARKVITQASLMKPTFRCSNFNTLFGTSAFIPGQFLASFQGNAVQSQSGGVAVNVQDTAANIHATFPENNAYVGASGQLVMPARRLTPAQAAYVQGVSGLTLPSAAISNVVWASTAGGQITVTLGTNLTANLAAGGFFNIANVVNTGGASSGVFNGLFQVVSINSTTIVAAYPAGGSPGTYASGGSVNLYTYRASVQELKQVFDQYLGYSEVKYQLENGEGAWWDPLWWYRANSATSQEIDLAEGLNTGPGGTSTTYHQAGGGSVSLHNFVDNQANGPVYAGLDWVDNLDGSTVTMNYYFNRRLVGALGSAIPATQFTQPMYPIADITMGSVGGNVNQYTPANWLMQIFSWNFWSYVNGDAGQMPLILTNALIAGTRGNGNTLTATNAVWDWGPITILNELWFSYTPQAGLVQIASGTLTFSDLTALQSATIVYEQWVHNNQFGGAAQKFSISTAYIDPGTLPNASLLVYDPSGNIPHGQAQGAVLGGFYNQALASKMSITSSDVSGIFQIGPDGVQLQAGPNFAAQSAGSYTVYVTQTSWSGVPTPLAQTFSVTLS